MWPPASAMAPSESPLKGTLIILMPAAFSRRGAKICDEEAGIMLTRHFPGFFLASSTRSLSVFHGAVYCTATAAGAVLTMATSSKFASEIGVGTVYCEVTAEVEKKPRV